MTLIKIALLVLVVCLFVTCDEYELPIVSLQALKPKGFRVFFPGHPKLKLFLFEGVISSEDTLPSESNNVIVGYGVKHRLGWLFEDLDISLRIGQSIVYRVFISENNPSFESKGANSESELKLFGITTKLEQFNITVLQDPLAHGPHCPATATLVHGGHACAGETIFEDNFDQFRDDLWQIEHYIPIDHPEHPFVSYQRRTSNPTVIIQNGTLQILPKLQEDLLKPNNQSILTATLDLSSGCTQHLCSMTAVGPEILPPIVSGRLTSARFAFTYGTVYIRAKLPKGDWIYPEILLEPLSKKYGALNYASGIIKIALARGNEEPGNDKFGNRMLSSGPIMNAKCRSALEFYQNRISSGYWSDEFHEFSFRWAPDGKEYGRYMPGAAGLKSWLPSSCRGEWYNLLKTGGRMAPFDDFFQITLGVAVGGTMEFRDGLKSSNGESKPWRNPGHKASFSFWQNRESWLPTWSHPDLIVDYVRVVAL